jgi:hypothetical protein
MKQKHLIMISDFHLPMCLYKLQYCMGWGLFGFNYFEFIILFIYTEMETEKEKASYVKYANYKKIINVEPIYEVR